MIIKSLKIFAAVFLFTGIISSCHRKPRPEQSDNPYGKESNEVKKRPAKTEGQLLYEQYCLSCHQTDGSGVPGMYPPLKESEWVSGESDKLISTVLNGVTGTITVAGELYDQEMPAQDYLEDTEIMMILNYIRKVFGNNAPAIQVEQISALREKKVP